MAYSSEIYSKADYVLAERRRSAEQAAELRRTELYIKYPELGIISKTLCESVAELSRCFMDGKADFSDIKRRCDEAKAEKERFLDECGCGKNYTMPIYSCHECEDTGWVHGVRCGCYREVCRTLALAELAESSGSADCSFENFNLNFYPDEGGESSSNPRYRMKTALESCKKYANTFSLDSPNLFFFGKTGLGKTHLSLAIAKTAVEKGFGVIYAPAQKLVSMLEKEHFSSGEGKGSYLKYSGCDLLIIDDLGAEFSTQFTVSSIGNLINERICNNLPTIISTNYLPDDIQKAYSERVYSRIVGCYKRFWFIGKDIRIRSAL